MWKPSDKRSIILSLLFLGVLAAIYVFGILSLLGIEKTIPPLLFSCLFVGSALWILARGFAFYSKKKMPKDVLDTDLMDADPQPVHPSFSKGAVWGLCGILAANASLSSLLLFSPWEGSLLLSILAMIIHLISAGGLWMIVMEGEDE